MTAAPDQTNRLSPSQSRSRDRVAKVLDAAERVLARDGYEGASLQSFAKEAGVSQTSLYRYWPNKQGVFMAISDRFMAERATTMEGWVARAAQGITVDEIVSMIVASMNEDYGNTDWMPACMIALRSDAELRKVDQEINRYFTGRFDQLLKAAGFTGPAARRKAVAAMMTVLLDAFLAELLRLDPKQRPALSKEFEAVLSAYLGQVLPC